MRSEKATVDLKERSRRPTHLRHLGKVTIGCPFTVVLSRLDFTLELPLLFSLSEANKKVTFSNPSMREIVFLCETSSGVKTSLGKEILKVRKKLTLRKCTVYIKSIRSFIRGRQSLGRCWIFQPVGDKVFSLLFFVQEQTMILKDCFKISSILYGHQLLGYFGMHSNERQTEGSTSHGQRVSRRS